MGDVFLGNQDLRNVDSVSFETDATIISTRTQIGRENGGDLFLNVPSGSLFNGYFNGNIQIELSEIGKVFISSPLGSNATDSGFHIFTSNFSGMTANIPALTVFESTVGVASGSTLTRTSWLEVEAPTYNGVAGGAAETITDAATFYIPSAPIQGTDITITNKWAVWIDDGDVRLDGSLMLGAGQSVKRTSSSAGSYTILATDYYIGKTGITGGGDTVTLPAAATVSTGKVYIIKDESGTAGTNSITIDGNGTETIDGAATKIINTNFGSASIITDGSNWFII